jgi:hypothetical protein
MVITEAEMLVERARESVIGNVSLALRR